MHVHGRTHAEERTRRHIPAHVDDYYPDAERSPVQNPVGVCREAEHAVQRVSEALRDAQPGAVGTIHAVPINSMNPAASYVRDRMR
jgi:hypothetical protein